MGLNWSDVLTELVLAHRVSVATAGIWAVGRWVLRVRSRQGLFGRTEWWTLPPMMWALETTRHSWTLWMASVWKPPSIVAFFALANAANVLGLLTVLLLVTMGLAAAPRLQIRPLAVVGVLAAVASALFDRALQLWGGAVAIAAQIEGSL